MSLSLARCFALKSKDGYFSEGYQPETLNESDDEYNGYKGSSTGRVLGDRDVTFNAFLITRQDEDEDSSYASPSGIFAKGAFSLLTPSMWPSDVITALNSNSNSNDSSDSSSQGHSVEFDEYGFLKSSKGDENDGESPSCTRKLQQSDIQEESALRTKWISFLEINYNKDVKPRMRWCDVEAELTHSSSLDDLIMTGVPNSMRSQLWLRFSKGIRLASVSSSPYAEMVDLANVEASLDKQITGVLGQNACFMTAESVGTQRLIRILRVLTWMHRTTSYSGLISSSASAAASSLESINIPLIVAHLLLICEEEEAFWLTQSILLEMKNLDHQSILKGAIEKACPDFFELLQSHQIEISLITWHWFSSLYASFLPTSKLLFRLWDFYFYHGPIVLLHLTIGLIIEKRKEWNDPNQDSAEFFNKIEDLPLACIKSESDLVRIVEAGKEIVMPLGSLITSSCHPLTKSSLGLNSPCKKDSKMDIRKKNVLQTSLLIDLHESIVAIGQHFETYDPKFKANFTIDLSESSSKECDDSSGKNSRNKKPATRLARALVDFQRSECDEFELGFKKNDIITVLSEKDEDCWIGELDGKQGWFPAKFVQLLEQNCEYSPAGDDQVASFINDLVRGRLCTALKAILVHGLKQSLLFTHHPWNIITSITKASIDSDSNSVYSKFVLTKSFRLDEFSRVLTPSEFLYRAIIQIDTSHKDEPFDIRLRSLICTALNQKMLHLYWSVICKSQPQLLTSYYHDWSFLTSPVWRLVRAELRLLDQFTFHLDPEGEIKGKAVAVAAGSPISKDGVQDMLVKHHLFSWDI